MDENHSVFKCVCVFVHETQFELLTPHSTNAVQENKFVCIVATRVSVHTRLVHAFRHTVTCGG